MSRMKCLFALSAICPGQVEPEPRLRSCTNFEISLQNMIRKMFITDSIVALICYEALGSCFIGPRWIFVCGQ